MTRATDMAFNALAHADWSVDPKRRWRVSIVRAGAGWRIDAAGRVDAQSGFLAEARRLPGPVLVGLDLPIGAPVAWAAQLGDPAFLDLAGRFGAGDWADFYAPARTSAEIALRRPFYPAGSGKKGEHTHPAMARALGVPNMDALRRWCEFDVNGKRSGTPLFWTNGPAQVGKAALHFWRTELAPELADGDVAVWPFDGDLATLADRGLVVAETYPGEAYGWFALEIGANRRRKSRRDDRRNDADRLMAAGEERGADFTPTARAQIEAGFPEGDDAFDAMVGALALLEVVRGGRPEGAPDDPDVRRIEGWILGREAAPRSALPR